MRSCLPFRERCRQCSLGKISMSHFPVGEGIDAWDHCKILCTRAPAHQGFQRCQRCAYHKPIYMNFELSTWRALHVRGMPMPNEQRLQPALSDVTVKVPCVWQSIFPLQQYGIIHVSTSSPAEIDWLGRKRHNRFCELSVSHAKERDRKLPNSLAQVWPAAASTCRATTEAFCPSTRPEEVGRPGSVG